MLIESKVRTYCRSFPVTFKNAKGSYLFDSVGNRYLDFLSGCGSLNYGHNHPILKEKLISYIESDGIAMSLDLFSESKNEFITSISEILLKTRNLEYNVQFTGPTGTNAVEAAIKLARIVTGRTNIISFTNAFHGCTLGSLALTGNAHHRQSSIGLLNQVTRAAYDRYFGSLIDTSTHLDHLLQDPSSGVDKPAAIIVETIQGEGGINVASPSWLRSIAAIAKKHGALFIIDDIQAGCGRSGQFFSFEDSGVVPDIITLAKSISGYGMPLSLVLMRPELDAWVAGEHNGTFRGNNLAFVTGSAALNYFWKDSSFQNSISEKSKLAFETLNNIAKEFGAEVRGRGLMLGLKFPDEIRATNLQKSCFVKGLILETCGANDEILKFLPPLTATTEELTMGFSIVEDTLRDAVFKSTSHSKISSQSGLTGS